MTAEQVQAAPELPDLDLATISVISVPEVWPPLDGRPAAQASPGFGHDLAAARRADRGDQGDRGDRGDQGDQGAPWPRQFAVLLAEALAGVRPLQQVLPCMSGRGSVQLRRLLPLFYGGYRPRVQRVLTTMPAADVIEMTLIVTAGPRTRALAVRLERATSAGPRAWRGKPSAPWLCTDIEAA
jgi:Family of unknown function (DUF6459)